MSKDKFCVRAGYWHEYTGIGRNKDENLTTNDACDLLNKQYQTIQNQKTVIMMLEHQSRRQINRNNRLEKDWDRLYEYLIDENVMTEEPYGLRDGLTFEFKNIQCNGKDLPFKEIPDRLNYLHKTIINQKQDLANHRFENGMLIDENETLKQALRRLVEHFDKDISKNSPVRELIE